MNRTVAGAAWVLMTACVADTGGLDGLEAEAPAFRIITERLEPAQNGTPYQTTLQTDPVYADTAWEVIEGPDFLAPAASTGPSLVLAGTPTDVGEVSLTVRARAPDGQEDERTFVIEVVYSVLVIDPATLPSAVAGSSYLASIGVGGGAPGTIAWRVGGGRLPPGLTLGTAADGRAVDILGVPEAIGTFEFTLEATDSDGNVAVETFRIPVEADLRIVAVNAPALRAGQASEGTWRVEGGIAPYAWTVTADSGLGLQSPPGSIGGVVTVSFAPTVAGPGVLNLRAQDTTGAEASLQVPLDVLSDVRIVTSTLDDGQQCLGYGALLEATGAGPQARYTWSLASGQLPPGITLDNTADGAFVRGVFIEAGTWPFTVRVEDEQGAGAERSFVLEAAAGELNARHVAVVGSFDRGAQDVLVVDVCGPRPVSETLVNPRSAPGTGQRSGPLAFSADAAQLAFVGDYDEPRRQDLFVTQVDQPQIPVGERLITAPDDGVVERFAWSPAGGHIAALLADVNGAYSLAVADVGRGRTVSLDANARPWSSRLDGLQWAPAAPPREPRFAWLRQETSTTQSLQMTLASGTTAQLSFGPTSVDRFAWRNARTVVYNQREGTRWDLYEADVDLRSRNRLTSVESNAPLQIAISPAGDGLAFFGGRSGYIRYTPTGPVGPQPWLNSLQNRVDQLVWLPRGDGAVLSAAGTALLATLRGDGTIQTTAFVLPINTAVTQVGLSDDGRFALITAVTGRQGFLHVADLESSQPLTTRVVSPLPSAGTLFGVQAVFSSPDGSRAAYAGEMTLRSRELFAVPLRGPAAFEPQQVTGPLTNTTGLRGAPAWRPDGSTIFYISDEVSQGTNELWMVNFFGGAPSPPGRVSVVPRIATRVQRFAVPE